MKGGRSGYNTGQRKAVLDYLKSTGGAHVTAKEAARHLQQNGVPVSLTTVYRHMERLVSDGSVKKYMLDEQNGACFQYCPEQGDPPAHFHLKCEGCGRLIHLQCDFMDNLKQHVMDGHGFSVNHKKTVFYGTCADCAKPGT